MPKPTKLSAKMRSGSSSSSFASSSLDLTVATDTAELSDHGPVIGLQVCLGQWPGLKWHGAWPSAHKSCIHGHRFYKRGGDCKNW